MTDVYYEKYIKYKTKYLGLINTVGGRKNNLVIHISGPSGAGKTTLGNKFKKKFGTNIVVKDIDDLQTEFMKKESIKTIKQRNINKYQEWIDEYVSKQNKPLIFVGLNYMSWGHKDYYYDMHSQYNFYINIDTDTIFEQKCTRFLTSFSNKNLITQIVNNIIKKGDEVIKDLQTYLENECGYKEIKTINEKLNTDYKKQGYVMLNRQDIFKRVSDIIKKEIN
jgi:2-phosphoglycerate kinase